MPLNETGSADPMLGSVIGGRYRVVRLLGEGGMGRVYVAEQQMGTAVRQVAVKTLLQEFSRDPQVQGRFHRECGTVVGLEHTNTIKFYDFGTTDAGDLYIAMEFVNGKPLIAAIEAAGRMAPARVEHIMKQVCGSLHEAHEKGIVHRDLKPENVILTEQAGESDFVKVLDFGIAKRSDAADQAREQKLTQAGMVLGTPPYMSPEQFTGKDLDRRSDIYSLGVMAYEMLAGKLPFEANTPWEWATQHMTAQPFPFEHTTGQYAAHIPPAMKQAIRRALSKNRDERQATAKEFFQEFSGGAATGAQPVSGVPATEAFAMPPSLQGRPGATQVGDAFGPGGYANANPGGAAQVNYGAPTPAPMHGPGGYPTPGPQMVPTGPQPQDPSSGGNKLALLGVVGLLAAGVVGGGVWFIQNHGEETEPVPARKASPSAATPAQTSADAPSADAPTAGAEAPAASAEAPAAGDADTGAVAPGAAPPPPVVGKGTTPTPPPTKPAPANGCDEAISAAMAGRCGQASAAMARCTGPQKSIAAANLTRCQQKAPPRGRR